MMSTLNNCIFDSIYFLVTELNKIDKFNNLIEMDSQRNFIKSILLDYEHLLIEDDILKNNIETYFPLIRKNSIHLSNYKDEEPDFLLYFLSGTFFSNDSQKTIEILKNYKPSYYIKTPLFLYFITNASKNGGLIFLEDTISMNFNTIHTIVNDDFDIIIDNKQKELRYLYLQNNIIAELGRFFFSIYSDLIYTKQRFCEIKDIYNDESLLLTTYPAILKEYNYYKIPKSLNEKDINLRFYELLAFANLKLYLKFKFNLNNDKELLDKVMIQTILSYCLHPLITKKYFNKKDEDDYKEEKDDYVLFAKCINDIIDLWASKDFKSAAFEYKYYYAFRPYEIEYENQ